VQKRLGPNWAEQQRAETKGFVYDDSVNSQPEVLFFLDYSKLFLGTNMSRKCHEDRKTPLGDAIISLFYFLLSL
jgi:hypothetical protein